MMEVALFVALLVPVAWARLELQSRLSVVDCEDVYLRDNTSSSGVYAVYPGGPASPLHVYCDMDTDGGPWTVFQRRMNGSENFNRTWNQYKTGFGNVTGEHWLGLDNIHLLSTMKWYQLRVDLESWEDERAHTEYFSFSVDSESTGYQLRLGTFTGGDAGDSLSNHDSMKSTTYDRDQDPCERNNSCHAANPNGVYAPHAAFGLKDAHVTWQAWKGRDSLKAVSMKIRAAEECECM